MRFWWIWLKSSVPPFLRAVGPSIDEDDSASHSGSTSA
jgi:hypothetical protein